MTSNGWTRWFHRRSDDDFAAEIESHLEMEVDRLVSSGMSEREARFAARRTFGNATSARERFHENRPGASLEWIAQDTRYALRGMRRNPAFTVIAIASLAIGIGTNSTIFGVIDTMLLRPPSQVRDADRIHRIYVRTPNDNGSAHFTNRHGYNTYVALRERVHGFEAVGAFWQMQVSSGHGADARAIDAVAVTPSVFTLLGIRPAMGRFFAADDELDEGHHAAVLGFRAWRTWYGGDSTVLGRSIDVEGLPYTIIGVAPEGFTGIEIDPVDLWVPIGIANRKLSPGAVSAHGSGYWFELLAKDRPHANIAQIERDATRIYQDIFRDEPRFAQTFAKPRIVLGPIESERGPAPSANAGVSMWVAAVSVLVLLIACANVANLLLLRGLARARETALRLSLGAARSRLVGQSLVEGMLLAASGGACTIMVGHWSSAGLRHLLIPGAQDADFFDRRLIVYTAAVALVTGLFASLLPAFVTARRDFATLLNSGRSSASPNRLRIQRVLIGAQVTLAMLLLVCAGLFVTSLRNVSRIDLGFDVAHVLYVNFPRANKRWADDSLEAARALATYQGMLERVRRIHGVADATLTAGEPFASGWGIALRRRGAPEPAPGTPMPFGRGVGTRFFETMRIRLKRGRFFTAADHTPKAHVAIVDDATARHYWPNENPLGKCVYLGDENVCTQIVGVVANTVLWDVTSDKGNIVYLPLESPFAPLATMIEVRTAGDPVTFVAAVRQSIASVSPNLPWIHIWPISDQFQMQLTSWKVGAFMFTTFGVLALILAAIGLHGLLSYVVAQRTHEIGVRKALGALDADLIRAILRDAMSTMLVGVLLGVIAALGAVRLIAHLLYGVSPHDPVVIIVGGCVLMLVGIAACLAPARRAVRVDPLVALRAE